MCFRRETRLVPSVTAPSAARGIVRQLCAELRLPELSNTAALLTSELVTNAVRHAPGPLRLNLSATKGKLVISVYDEDSQPPRPRSPEPREPGGRGLVLVDRLAEHWGCTQVPDDGKVVWFALRPQRPPVAERECSCDPRVLEDGLL